MKKNINWIICFISFLMFIILGIFVLNKKVINIDFYVYNLISPLINNHLTINIKILTFIGNGIIVSLITIFILIFFKNKKYGLFLSIDLVLITFIQIILKNLFARARPINIDLISANGYSFPSGHSLTAFAFYGFIIYLIYISKLKKDKKIIFISLVSILILLIGFSRIYLGVHFFSDVIGGFLFSLAFLIIYINLIKNKIE